MLLKLAMSGCPSNEATLLVIPALYALFEGWRLPHGEAVTAGPRLPAVSHAADYRAAHRRADHRHGHAAAPPVRIGWLRASYGVAGGTGTGGAGRGTAAVRVPD